MGQWGGGSPACVAAWRRALLSGDIHPHTRAATGNRCQHDVTVPTMLSWEVDIILPQEAKLSASAKPCVAPAGVDGQGLGALQESRGRKMWYIAARTPRLS